MITQQMDAIYHYLLNCQERDVLPRRDDLMQITNFDQRLLWRLINHLMQRQVITCKSGSYGHLRVVADLPVMGSNIELWKLTMRREVTAVSQWTATHQRIETRL